MNKSGMLLILRALFRNKLRFGDGVSHKKKIASSVLFAVVAALLLTLILVMVVRFGGSFAKSEQAQRWFYFIILLTSGAIVLLFGIFSLVSMLFLSKDTDFYSMLPVKSVSVFIAKLLFVYICETAITVLVGLPAIITFGITAKITLWYFYVISIATVAIVPAMPLALAAIFAVPVMFIAAKLRNRTVVPLIFYCLMFVAFFGLYFYFIFSVESLTTGMVSIEKIEKLKETIELIGLVFFPYTVLSASALGMSLYGIPIAVEILIFLACSAAFVAILIALGKLMYSQSVKANNQTDNSKAKKGSFKSRGSLRALIMREYKLALRSTQVIVQCFIGYILVILFAAIYGYLMFDQVTTDNSSIDSMLFLISISIISAMMSATTVAPMTSISREGKAVESLKILPITPKRMVAAKYLSWLVFALPSALCVGIVINAFSFEVGRFFLSLAAIMLLTAAFTLFGVLWDLQSPKLKWTDPMQAIKHNTHQLFGMLMEMAAPIAALISTMLFISSASIDVTAMNITVWTILYGCFAIFTSIDIILYRKVDVLYNRIEI